MPVIQILILLNWPLAFLFYSNTNVFVFFALHSGRFYTFSSNLSFAVIFLMSLFLSLMVFKKNTYILFDDFAMSQISEGNNNFSIFSSPFFLQVDFLLLVCKFWSIYLMLGNFFSR